jgi:uncharacterized peroxidase-related enzyme
MLLISAIAREWRSCGVFRASHFRHTHKARGGVTIEQVNPAMTRPATPRITRLTRNEVDSKSGEIFDRMMQQRGNVPNMFRTLAHRPEIFQTAIAHLEAVINTGTLSPKLKELVVVRTSQINGCEYCLASHSLIAIKLGWTQQHLDEAANFGSSTLFTPMEKTVLHLAERMTLNEAPVTQDEFHSLREFFSEGEIVELMAACGLFNYFNRFNNFLDMEPTKNASEASASEPAGLKHQHHEVVARK